MPPSASDRRPESLDVAAVGCWWLSAGRNKRRAAAGLEHRTGPLCHIATDRIEDRIAIGRNLRKIDGVVVNNFICSDAAHILKVCRTRGRKNMRANMLGQLNGEAGDPACPTLHQD